MRPGQVLKKERALEELLDTFQYKFYTGHLPGQVCVRFHHNQLLSLLTWQVLEF